MLLIELEMLPSLRIKVLVDFRGISRRFQARESQERGENEKSEELGSFHCGPLNPVGVEKSRDLEICL